MTLREKCEQAANEILDLDLSRPRGEEIADAIERVARAFAERALTDIVRCTEINPNRYDEFVANAIAAAERGE